MHYFIDDKRCGAYILCSKNKDYLSMCVYVKESVGIVLGYVGMETRPVKRLDRDCM